MPSKTWGKPPPKTHRWKAARGCAEPELIAIASALAKELLVGDRVQLEGPLGAGKSTFARALLEGLGVHQPPEGSPTFAIAHEYVSPRGAVVHVDFYRLRSEAEIEAAGIDAYFWERPAIVLCEWLSAWPDFQQSVLKTAPGRVWSVALVFTPDAPDRREVTVDRIG